MKRLLTFIYGLLYFTFALGCIMWFDKTEAWYRFIYLALAIVLIIDGFRKLDKATE